MASHESKASRFSDDVRDPKSLWEAKRNSHGSKLDVHLSGRVFPRAVPDDFNEDYGNLHDWGSRNQYRKNTQCLLGGNIQRMYTSASSHKFKVEAELPTFNGSSLRLDFLDWFDLFEDYFDALDPPDAVKCKLVASKLRGEAHIWWRDLQNHRISEGKNLIASWPRMRELLINKFLHTSCLTYVHNQLNNHENEGNMKHTNCWIKVPCDSHNNKQVRSELDTDSIDEEVKAKSHGITKEENAQERSIRGNSDPEYDHFLTTDITGEEIKNGELKIEQRSHHMDSNVQESEQKETPTEELQLKSFDDWNTPTIRNSVAKQTKNDGLNEVKAMTSQVDLLMETPNHVVLFNGKFTPLIPRSIPTEVEPCLIKVRQKTVEDEFRVRWSYESYDHVKPKLKNWTTSKLLEKFVDVSDEKSFCTVRKICTILPFGEYMVFCCSNAKFASFIFDPGGTLWPIRAPSITLRLRFVFQKGGNGSPNMLRIKTSCIHIHFLFIGVIVWTYKCGSRFEWLSWDLKIASELSSFRSVSAVQENSGCNYLKILKHTVVWRSTTCLCSWLGSIHDDLLSFARVSVRVGVDEYNCFLNVIILSQWNLKRFQNKSLRRSLLKYVCEGRNATPKDVDEPTAHDKERKIFSFDFLLHTSFLLIMINFKRVFYGSPICLLHLLGSYLSSMTFDVESKESVATFTEDRAVKGWDTLMEMLLKVDPVERITFFLAEMDLWASHVSATFLWRAMLRETRYDIIEVHTINVAESWLFTVMLIHAINVDFIQSNYLDCIFRAYVEWCFGHEHLPTPSEMKCLATNNGDPHDSPVPFVSLDDDGYIVYTFVNSYFHTYLLVKHLLDYLLEDHYIVVLLLFCPGRSALLMQVASSLFPKPLSPYILIIDCVRNGGNGDEPACDQSIALKLFVVWLCDCPCTFIFEAGMNCTTGLSKMEETDALCGVGQHDTEHGIIICKPPEQVLFLTSFNEPWDYIFRITRGRVIPRKGWNDENNFNTFIMARRCVTISLCLSVLGKNGLFKRILKLFYKVLNGLDPPKRILMYLVRH